MRADPPQHTVGHSFGWNLKQTVIELKTKLIELALLAGVLA